MHAETYAARRQILAAAQQHRQRLRTRVPFEVWPGLPPAFTMRRIQWAAHVCRRNRLVSADVMRAAGFRP
jgi:hypothetical protein